MWVLLKLLEIEKRIFIKPYLIVDILSAMAYYFLLPNRSGGVLRCTKGRIRKLLRYWPKGRGIK